MGQLILCKTSRADTPYYIESGQVRIYCLEELMYYVRTAQIVTRDDFMNEAFITWVEDELHMPQLSKLLFDRIAKDSGLKDFFVPLEAANNYLTTSELQILNVQLEKYDHLTSLEAKKLYADQFMQQQEYVEAIHAYRALLNDTEVIKKQGHVAGDIWSNLGCAYARLQDFSEAVECFVRGYTLNHRMETMQEAVDAAYLSKQTELLEMLKERFAVNAGQITAEEAHMEQLFLQASMQDYEKSYQAQGELLQTWLDQYRSRCV